MNIPFVKDKLLSLVILISVLIGVSLAFATWNINFWPTDTEDYYIEAARNLPNLKYISQMHESLDQTRVVWLHGKEGYILTASWMQRLMNDVTTLRPFVVVNIIAVVLSAILIFLIIRNYWGLKVGFICWFLFATSFWPYIYILFAKHQSLGLCFFLVAVGLLHLSDRKWGKGFLVLSGLSLCFSIYTSTASSLYLLYYIGALIWQVYTAQHKEGDPEFFFSFLFAGFLSLVGFSLAFIYFNYPNIVYNVKSYLEYVEISGQYNHFFYNQPVLQQWISTYPMNNVRGGWLWVFKYFFLIMPVVFPVFLLCHIYLIRKCIQQRSQRLWFGTVAILGLGWSSPILAQLRGVAQYGANYFPSFVGIIVVIGYSIFVYLSLYDPQSLKDSKSYWTTKIVGTSILIFHVILNNYVFLSDIYPTRMVTTFLSNAIEKLGVQEIYTYRRHPQRKNVVDYLNPGLVKKLKFIAINHIYEPTQGYILVPPITGNSIYIAATSDYNDFDQDIFLNELVHKGNMNDYAVASFKTLAASRIWPQEEEILSYRYLILNQLSADIMEKGKVWLLDVQKLRQDMKKNFPPQEDFWLVSNEIKNIGTKRLVYIYKGNQINIRSPGTLKKLATRIYKVGQPKDSLRAFVYRVDTEQTVWVPYNEHFVSELVEAGEITNDSNGQIVQFNFTQPLPLSPGPYYFVIYRTGKRSDQDFYRIYKNQVAILDY